MRLRHVAYVTRDVDRKAAQLVALLGFQAAGPFAFDCAQGVRIQLMETGDSGLLELLEPYGEKTPVHRHLGGGLFHLCFEVDDLDGTLQRLRDTGEAIVVREPLPASEIDNRRVAFVVTTSRDLITKGDAPALLGRQQKFDSSGSHAPGSHRRDFERRPARTSMGRRENASAHRRWTRK